MKSNIRQYIESIAHDNKEYINSTIANYVVENAENSDSWNEFFNLNELEENQGEVTDEQIQEVKDYLLENFNYTIKD